MCVHSANLEGLQPAQTILDYLVEAHASQANAQAHAQAHAHARARDQGYGHRQEAAHLSTTMPLGGDVVPQLAHAPEGLAAHEPFASPIHGGGAYHTTPDGSYGASQERGHGSSRDRSGALVHDYEPRTPDGRGGSGQEYFGSPMHGHGAHPSTPTEDSRDNGTDQTPYRSPDHGPSRPEHFGSPTRGYGTHHITPTSGHGAGQASFLSPNHGQGTQPRTCGSHLGDGHEHFGSPMRVHGHRAHPSRPSSDHRASQEPSPVLREPSQPRTPATDPDGQGTWRRLGSRLGGGHEYFGTAMHGHRAQPNAPVRNGPHADPLASPRPAPHSSSALPMHSHRLQPDLRDDTAPSQPATQPSRSMAPRPPRRTPYDPLNLTIPRQGVGAFPDPSASGSYRSDVL